MAYFKGFFWHLLEGTDGSNTKKPIRITTCWDRFILRAFQCEAGLLTTEV
jgi:hypothetical protein